LTNQDLLLEIHLYGFLTLVSVLIALFLVILILIKAIKTKEIKLYLFTIAAFAMISPWFPTTIGYIYWIMTMQMFSKSAQLLLGLVFVPVAILSWLEIYRRVKSKRLGLILIISYGILSILAELFLIYYLYVAPGAPVESMIADTQVSSNYVVHINYKGILVVYALISICIAWITGIHFALISIKQGSTQIIRLRGKLILIGFNLFLITVIIESFYIFIIIMIIARILLVTTIVFLYLGFVFPTWLEKRIVK